MTSTRFDHVLSDALAKNSRTEGVRIGWIAAVNDSGEPLADYPGNPSGPVPARAILTPEPGGWRKVSEDQSSVVLVFEESSPRAPIILGIIQSNLEQVVQASTVAVVDDKPQDVKLDGRRIVLEAKNEIMLRCGKGSILIRKDGKIVIKGTKLVSRSKGVNKIKGGAVQIN